MAYDSLADFVKALEGAGELKRIKVPVSPELEITEIADRTVKRGGPALLFENVMRPGGEPFSMPLLINAFGTIRRMALALGVEDVDLERGTVRILH
ncbi:MAG: hypothetical protein ACE5LX_00250, partial [Nitrospinota bacterium]